MVDRISNIMLTNRYLWNMNNSLNALQKINEQVASGKTINSASDNPAGSAQVMTLQNDIKKVEQYQKNMEYGISFLENTSSVISKVEDILSEIRNIAESASSDVVTSAERMAYAFDVDQLLEELIMAANSKFGGRFIFGGVETMSGSRANSAPFNIVTSGNSISQVIPNPDGINGTIKNVVGDGKSVIINIAGDDVFQPNGSEGAGDLFATVIDLRENLRGNDGASIRERIPELESVYSQVLNQNTIAGAKITQMEGISTDLDDLALVHKDTLSDVEDTDIAEALMQLNLQQVSLQAVMQVSSKILTQSLFDYL